MRQKVSQKIASFMQLVSPLLHIVSKDWKTIALVTLSLLPLNTVICIFYDRYAYMITIRAQMKTCNIWSVSLTGVMILLSIASLAMTFAISIKLLSGSKEKKPIVVRELFVQSWPLVKLLCKKLVFLVLVLAFVCVSVMPSLFILSLLIPSISMQYAIYVDILLCILLGLAIIQKSWCAPQFFILNSLSWKKALKKSRQALKGKVMHMYINTLLLTSILWLVPIMLYLVSWVLGEEISFLLHSLIIKILVATYLQFFLLLFCMTQNMWLQELPTKK